VKHNASQDVQTPGLQPGNFFDTSNSVNQATIPQHVHWPTQQKTDEDQECDAKNYSDKFC
jgi:hypothetical protein